MYDKYILEFMIIIQMLFFMIQEEYKYIGLFLFFLLGVIVAYGTIHSEYAIIPLIVVQIIYICYRIQKLDYLGCIENFKRRRRLKKRKKKINTKKLNRTKIKKKLNQTKIKKKLNQTKIKKKLNQTKIKKKLNSMKQDKNIKGKTEDDDDNTKELTNSADKLAEDSNEAIKISPEEQILIDKEFEEPE